MATQPDKPAHTGGNSPQQPATTQEELTQDSGAGIRGGYGDSDQTNGLEGGQQTPPDRTPNEQAADQEE